MRISNYPVDAWYFRQFFGCALRVAASHDDLAAGIVTMYASDRTANVLVGRSGDSAGVQDNDLGLGSGFGARKTALKHLALDGGAIGLSGATSEIFHKKRSHENSLY